MAVNEAIHSAPPPEIEHTPTNCRAREMLVRVADKWSMYIIHVLAEAGPLRFSELRRRVDGVSQRMLTVTLRGLERDGLVSRTMYPEVPPRVEYELTPLGATLRQIVHAHVVLVALDGVLTEDRGHHRRHMHLHPRSLPAGAVLADLNQCEHRDRLLERVVLGLR